jgi:hypothetical protein
MMTHHSLSPSVLCVRCRHHHVPLAVCGPSDEVEAARILC